MADFTISTYLKLLGALKAGGYGFQTFHGYIAGPQARTIILRHDVDRVPANSLRFARIQHDLGITGTYYFRIVSSSFREEIIREIYDLGHEIGYHYEDVVFASRRLKMYDEKHLADNAIRSFSENLTRLREIVPVHTICMHGSPMSRWDSRLLWKFYDYRDFGIEGEPYLSKIQNELLYLTDTGRSWDGDRFNVRDRPFMQGSAIRTSHSYHSTFDIIRSVISGDFPDKAMITIHPQRWTNNSLLWMTELVSQRIKNGVKYILINKRMAASGNTQ